jgi:hypothetical protein
MCDQLSTAKSIGTSQQRQLFSCRDDLKTHIAAVHIQCYNYFCQICVDYPRFATASALNKHYDGMHATDEYTVTFGYIFCRNIITILSADESVYIEKN